MWKITALDYEAPLFANAEAREIAGVAPMLWAKWIQRGMGGPSRTIKGGRAGQYAAKKIFEMRVMNVVVQQTAIPISEAQQIAELAAKGTWSIKELADGAANQLEELCPQGRSSASGHPPHIFSNGKLLGLRNSRGR